jgi:hypothetical protein
MKLRLSINESDKKVLFHQQNSLDIQKDIIKVRQSLSENITYEFHYTGNIVEFQVSFSGTYKIEAWGARGGSSSNSTGPFGAYSKSYVFLNKDDRIKILVGEKGYPGCSLSSCNSYYIYNDGGGGGTFITKDRTPLCVAGGGGGFTYRSYSTVQSHACGQSTQLSANIGNGQASLKIGGSGGTHSGGGGGFEGNGGDGISSYDYRKGGYSFINGGARQTSGNGNNPWAYGGFGGGGSQCGSCHLASGAGGGGYTGGSASDSNTNQGGGGGSYFEGSYNHESSLAISGCDPSLPTNPGTYGNGFARLTLFMSTSDLFNKKVSCYQCKSLMLWTFYLIILSQ